MEIEYIACYEATHQAIWLKKFIVELGIVKSKSRLLTIYCHISIGCASLVIITLQNGQNILTQNSCLLERRSRSFKLELSLYPQNL